MTVACVVQARDALGESPIWCARTRRLWWVDITQPCLQSFDPASGVHRVIALPGRFCGCIALRAAGGLVLAIERSLHAFDPETGALDPAGGGSSPISRTTGSMTAVATGAAGCGSAPWTRISAGPPALLSRRSGPHVTRLFGDVLVPNSTAFSPDDRTLYFADTPRHQILAFDLDLDAGTIANRRVFVDLTPPGGPAGRLLRRCGGLPVERRVRRRSARALRARRPRRPHDRDAGQPSDLLLLRRRQPRHALCHQRILPPRAGRAPSLARGLAVCASIPACAACRRPPSVVGWIMRRHANESWRTGRPNPTR